MRKIIILCFVSLDGVMQAPGGPDEDRSGAFNYGGWTVPFFDEFLGEVMTRQMSLDCDLLLGRKTYDIFAAYWPGHNEEGESLNKAKKFVVSHQNLELFWNNSELISGDVVEKIRFLKSSEGPDLQVHGSSELIQTLLKFDLVDEFWLKIFPLTLGSGKRLFGEGTIPVSFTLTQVQSSPRGVIVASYKRAGSVETGSF